MVNYSKFECYGTLVTILMRSKSKRTVAECYRYREPCCRVRPKGFVLKKRTRTLAAFRRTTWDLTTTHDNDGEINKPFNYNGVRERGSTRYTRAIAAANGPTIGLYCAVYSDRNLWLTSSARPNTIRNNTFYKQIVYWRTRVKCVWFHSSSVCVCVWRGTNFTYSQRWNNRN